jgi:O-succinylhomoserine sulfhydrylase
MDGQGRVLGGVTVGDPELIQKNLFIFDLQDPLYSNAWVFIKSLETLAIRWIDIVKML